MPCWILFTDDGSKHLDRVPRLRSRLLCDDNGLQRIDRVRWMSFRVLFDDDGSKRLDRVRWLRSRLLRHDHGLQCIYRVCGMPCGVLFDDDGSKRLDCLRRMRRGKVPDINWRQRFRRMHRLCRW